MSVTRQLNSAGVAIDLGWWRRAAELGWAALLVPEEIGGGAVSDSGVEDLAAITELIGRTAFGGPLHPVSTALVGLVEGGHYKNHLTTSKR